MQEILNKLVFGLFFLNGPLIFFKVFVCPLAIWVSIFILSKNNKNSFKKIQFKWNLFVAFLFFEEVSSTRLVCYYTNWSQSRPGLGRFLPTDIDPNLCTHLIYAFADINATNQLATVEWNDVVLYESFNGLKLR